MKWARESFVLVALPVVILVSASILALGLDLWLRGAGRGAGSAGGGSPRSSGADCLDLARRSGGAGSPLASGTARDGAGESGDPSSDRLRGSLSALKWRDGAWAVPGSLEGGEGLPDSPPPAPEQDAAGGDAESRRPARSVVVGSVATSAGDPLGGARLLVRESVGLLDSSGKSVFGEAPWRELGYSSLNGTFELDTVPGIVYEIMAEAEGFASGWTRIGGVAKAPVLTLAPAASFRGFVRSREEGTPIPQAYVRLRSAHIDRSAVTDSHGEFSLSGLLVGPAVLELVHHAFKPVSAIVDVGVDGQGAYEMEHGGLLLGRVRLADSEASLPPHLPVQLRNLQTMQVTGVAATGPFGTFTFQSLVVGSSYRVTVFANELGVHSLDFISHAVPDGQQVEIVIEPLWSLTGTVTTTEGVPVPGASVLLRSTASGGDVTIPPVAAGEDGDFHFAGLGAGSTYELVAFHPSFSIVQIGGIRSESHGQGDLHVVMPPGVKIYGRLTPATPGASLEGTMLRLRADPFQNLGRITLYAFADDSGDFAFAPVPPSHCQVTVIASGYRTLRDEFSTPSGDPEVFLEYILAVDPNVGR